MSNQDYTQWHLPKGAKLRLGKGWIRAIAYSPDGTRLAVASSIGIWIYDAHTYEELALFTGHTSSIESITYSPDGGTIATGSEDVRLWDAFTGEHKTTLTERADRVDSVVYSPDGRTIAAKVGRYHPIGRNFIEYSVHLWDADTEKHKITLTENLHRTYSVAFSPDGKAIATGTHGKVLLWDADTGEHKSTLTGPTDSVGSVVFSPDGKTIATNSGTFGQETHLWDAATGKYKIMLTERGDNVAFSPDGKTIATESWSTVSLWDAETNACKSTLTGPNHRIGGISYSPDGKAIAAWTYEEVHLWDATTEEYKTTLTGHANIVRNVVYSPNGKTITTSCSNSSDVYRRVHLWDAETGKHKITQDKVVYSPDGKTIATWSCGKEKNQKVHLLDTATGGHKAALSEPVNSIENIVYSPDGKTIVIDSEDIEKGLEGFLEFPPREYKIHLWDTDAGKHKATLSEDNNDIEFFVYSPNGGTIAIWSWEREKDQQRVRLWDTATGKQITTFMGSVPHRPADSIMYSPDGKTIAISSDKEVHLWDTTTGEHKITLIGPTNSVESFVYSPDGKTIATRGYEEARYNAAAIGMTRITMDKKVYMWDAATGKRMWSLTTGKYHGFLGEERVVYSPDSSTIAVQSYDKEISLWDTITGKHKVTFSERTDSIKNFVFSPDGKMIAGKADPEYTNGQLIKYSTVRLWNTTTGNQEITLVGHTDDVTSLAYSPDGKTIVTGNDKEIYLWDTATGKQITTFTGHVGDIYSFSYSPGGKTIATGSDDGTVLLWETTSFIWQYPDVNPQEIYGNWRAGWALDVHSVSSQLLQDGKYDTQRTELGESIYQLKYHHDTNRIQPLSEIAAEFLKKEFNVDGHLICPDIEAILPIPLSSNETFQPVPEIAIQVGQILDVPVPLDYLIKVKNTGQHNFESEDSRQKQLHGAFAVQAKDGKYRCVLLLDDIYNSGVTLTEATEVLQKQGGISHVFVLTLTYTRTKR